MAQGISRQKLLTIVIVIIFVGAIRPSWALHMDYFTEMSSFFSNPQSSQSNPVYQMVANPGDASHPWVFWGADTIAPNTLSGDPNWIRYSPQSSTPDIVELYDGQIVNLGYIGSGVGQVLTDTGLDSVDFNFAFAYGLNETGEYDLEPLAEPYLMMFCPFTITIIETSEGFQMSFPNDLPSAFFSYDNNIYTFDLAISEDEGRYLSAQVSVNPVPEPSTMILVATGLIGFAGWRRRNAKKK